MATGEKLGEIPGLAEFKAEIQTTPEVPTPELPTVSGGLDATETTVAVAIETKQNHSFGIGDEVTFNLDTRKKPERYYIVGYGKDGKDLISAKGATEVRLRAVNATKGNGELVAIENVTLVKASDRVPIDENVKRENLRKYRKTRKRVNSNSPIQTDSTAQGVQTSTAELNPAVDQDPVGEIANDVVDKPTEQQKDEELESEPTSMLGRGDYVRTKNPKKGSFFDTSRQIAYTEDIDGETVAFFDDYDTGVPVDDLIAAEKPEAINQQIPTGTFSANQENDPETDPAFDIHPSAEDFDRYPGLVDSSDRQRDQNPNLDSVEPIEPTEPIEATEATENIEDPNPNFRENLGNAFRNVRESVGELLSEAAESETGIIVRASTIDRASAEFQDMLFDHHNQRSSEISADLKKVIVEKDKLLAEQARHNQMYENMEKNLGRDRVVVAMPEADKERRVFAEKIKNIKAKEFALSQKLEDRNNKRNRYETERNNIATEVIGRLERISEPHRQEIATIEAQKSQLALEITGFKQKTDEGELHSSEIRKKIAASEYKSEQKVLKELLKEIDSKLRQSRAELSDRNKELAAAEKSLEKARKPLREIDALKFEYQALIDKKRHEDLAPVPASPAPPTPTPTSTPTPGTFLNPATPYQVPATESVGSSGAASESKEIKREVRKLPVMEFAALWNQTFASKEKINAKDFSKFISTEMKLDPNSEANTNEFVRVAEAYLNIKRDAGAKVRPAKKISRDLKTFIDLYEHTITVT